MRRVLFITVGVAALAACAAEPKLASNAPPGISYRVEGNQLDNATKRAEQYCQQYRKHAQLQNVNHSGNDDIAVYACN